MLEEISAEYPHRVAVIDAETGGQRTYAQLQARACRVANALASLGIKQGDTFGLLMHNCIEYLEILYGAAKIGATAVLVNRRLSSSEMAYELNDSRSAGLVFSPKFAAAANDLKKNLDRKLWWMQSGGKETARAEGVQDLEAILSSASEAPPILGSEVDLSDAGWVIIYTSGTTGKPKGVVLTQGNIVAANNTTSRFIWARYGAALTPVVRGLVTAGLNHIGGLTTSSTPVLADGGQLVLLDDFDPRKMLAAIERYRINLAFSIGQMWNRVVEEDLGAYDFSSLQLIGTCIAQHTDRQLRLLNEGFGAEVYYMFGQTETTTGLVTTRRTIDLFGRKGTIGKPHGYMETRIVDDSGKQVPVGEVGELQYRGPTVFKEYYGKRDDTKNAFINGWFRSGDLVKEDADGYLYFADRLKDMVKSGGLNVFTVEVEQLLTKHPDIADCAVAGTPHEKWGEAVTAFIVPAKGKSLTAPQIIEFCRPQIAAYKIPKRICFVAEIPMNALGKRLKRELVSLVLSGKLVPEQTEA